MEHAMVHDGEGRAGSVARQTRSSLGKSGTEQSPINVR